MRACTHKACHKNPSTYTGWGHQHWQTWHIFALNPKDCAPFKKNKIKMLLLWRISRDVSLRWNKKQNKHTHARICAAFFEYPKWCTCGAVWLSHGWPVLHKTAAISMHVLCTPYNHAPVYSVTSFKATYIGRLAVTCHLHFWQNDQDLLHATVVTWGWNRY